MARLTAASRARTEGIGYSTIGDEIPNRQEDDRSCRKEKVYGVFWMHARHFSEAQHERHIHQHDEAVLLLVACLSPSQNAAWDEAKTRFREKACRRGGVVELAILPFTESLASAMSQILPNRGNPCLRKSNRGRGKLFAQKLHPRTCYSV